MGLLTTISMATALRTWALTRMVRSGSGVSALTCCVYQKKSPAPPPPTPQTRSKYSDRGSTDFRISFGITPA